jgi:hypothetical protein
MKAHFGRRAWVKLWVNDWLDGTTRYEMTGAQRAFWVDLLAMAGRSRQPGFICAGESGERVIGYPLSVFQGLDAGGEIDIPSTFQLFEACGKTRLEVTQETPVKLFRVEILNWGRYQSEYQRQKPYRDRKLPAKLQLETGKGNATEVEVEERIKTIRANPAGLHDGLESPADENHALIAVVGRTWAYYVQRLNKSPKLLTLTSLRQKKGLARLEECLEKVGWDLGKAEGLMRVAVDELAASDFHIGKNDRGLRYDSCEKNLFKSREQLEDWLGRSMEREG